MASFNWILSISREGGRFNNLSGQPQQELNDPHNDFFFFMSRQNFPDSSFQLLLFVLSLWTLPEESASIFFITLFPASPTSWYHKLTHLNLSVSMSWLQMCYFSADLRAEQRYSFSSTQVPCTSQAFQEDLRIHQTFLHYKRGPIVRDFFCLLPQNFELYLLIVLGELLNRAVHTLDIQQRD